MAGQIGLLGQRGGRGRPLARDGVYLSASDLGDDHRFTSMVHVDYPHPPDDAFHSLRPSLSFYPDKRNTANVYQNPGNLYQHPGTTHFSTLASLPPTMTATMTGVEQPSSVRPRRQLPKVPEDSAVTERANRLVSYGRGRMTSVLVLCSIHSALQICLSLA